MYTSECSHVREKGDKGLKSIIHSTTEFRFPSASKDVKERIKRNNEFLIEYLVSIEGLEHLGKSFGRHVFKDDCRRVEITYPFFITGFNLEVFCEEYSENGSCYNSENIFDLNKLREAILTGTYELKK